MEQGTRIEIQVNGEARSAARGTSVDAFVAELGLRPEVVAIEVNDRLVRRDERGRTMLSDGDRIEVVTLVGGG
ncbi:MAG: sulfur carrier protein ThiS [Planctomycetota bacterium]|nr:sulfur carrier protein ThiS [Planctomycetota bacterium]